MTPELDSTYEEPVAPAAFGPGAAVWRALLLVAFIALTIPLWITQMGIGLDASWNTALHMASAKGMVYGKDIVFTYGPLAFALLPKQYADLNVQAVALRLALHLLWWTSVGLLLFRIRGYAAPLVFVVASAFSGMALEQEFNFILAGALIMTTTGFLLLAELDRRPTWAIPAAIIAGAAVLTKFNLGVACTSALGAWSLMRLGREPNLRVLGRLTLLATLYFASLAILFRIYGGPLSALWPFIQGSRELASGYSAQMALDDPKTTMAPIIGLLAMIAVALIASLAARSSLTPSLVLMILPMFIFYKSAVVRQSAGHFLLAWPPMVSLTALLIPEASRRLRTRVGATIAVAAVVAVGFWYAPAKFEKVVVRGASNWITLCTMDNMRNAIGNLDQNLKKTRGLPPSFLTRIGKATVDVYPWEASYIWSNDLRWRPRPVFQSYSAFTPALDRMCADFLRGPNAPQFIVYSHIAIDGQQPCIVDPRTWLEIYRLYDLVDGHQDLLLLQRRGHPRWSGGDRVAAASTHLGERITIPEAAGGLVFMKANLELSLKGKLASTFYKVIPPSILIEFKNGEKARHRLVWRNTSKGFLINNLPRDLADVVNLFQKGEAQEVIAVTFEDPAGMIKPGVDFEVLKTDVRSAPVAAVAAAPETTAVR